MANILTSDLEAEIKKLKAKEEFRQRTTDILEMIAIGQPASLVYEHIALLYESRHPGMRCSMLELQDGKLLHGGAPSLPKKYCDAVHGLENGPNVGSCGTSTYTGERCIVENIETDPKWENLKEVALAHGMRCCWSEPIKNSKGKVLGAFGMYYNHPAKPTKEESDDLISAARITGFVMERDHNQKRIRELAYTDTLTQLPSRAYFYQYIETLIHSSKRHKRKFSLLYIDLDDFKHVNDTLGHDAGDQLLNKVAKRLKQSCRSFDLIARLSGDEFCMIIEDIKDKFISAKTAQRCIDVIAEPFNLTKKVPYNPGCSIGIAHYPNDGKTVPALIKAADTALYAAKGIGKGRYAFYEQEFTQKAEHQFHFKQSLREALDKNQFSLVYQPQFDINSKKIVGVETLTRWTHKDFNQVYPAKFFQTAEQIGMIKKLTKWVLHRACQQYVEWKQEIDISFRLAINITPSLFIDNDFYSLVKNVINQTSINPSVLEFEVTESVTQTSPKNLAIFKQLRDIGISLSIDDFGEGYSSFASLKHIEIDRIKIGKYFIDDIGKDRSSNLLISSMIDIAHSLGHEVIAEGVETEEQLIKLQKLNCEIAQGYLLSKPLSADDFKLLLSQAHI